jgi:hypothetical protein
MNCHLLLVKSKPASLAAWSASLENCSLCCCIIIITIMFEPDIPLSSSLSPSRVRLFLPWIIGVQNVCTWCLCVAVPADRILHPSTSSPTTMLRAILFRLSTPGWASTTPATLAAVLHATPFWPPWPMPLMETPPSATATVTSLPASAV